LWIGLAGGRSQMRRKLFMSLVPTIFMAMTVFPTIAAQGTPAPGTPAAGTGIPPVVWQLVKISPASGEELTPKDPSQYTIQFLPDGMALVQLDCNRGSGVYKIDGSNLTIGPIASTLMFCEEGSLDTQFGMALDQVESFAYAEDELVLTLSDGGTMHLTPSLVGVVWEWQDFLGGNGAKTVPDDPSKYTLSFNEDGTFAVRADCNVGSGTYTVNSSSIELKVGPLTRAMCPPESLSDRFLRDLGDTRSFVFRNGELYLALFADAGISRFAATAPTEATPTAGEGTPVGG
jgi:heat shock protein HslJ